jgi:hypothetical protein
MSVCLVLTASTKKPEVFFFLATEAGADGPEEGESIQPKRRSKRARRPNSGYEGPTLAKVSKKAQHVREYSPVGKSKPLFLGQFSPPSMDAHKHRVPDDPTPANQRSASLIAAHRRPARRTTDHSRHACRCART